MLLRDLIEGKSGDIAAVEVLIARAAADVLILSGVDYDDGLAALTALRDKVGRYGVRYEHLFAAPPNAGHATDHDLDGDGYTRGARDAQGYGVFAGQGGLAILSHHPIDNARDFSDFLWRDLPGALITTEDPGWDDQRLSSTAHWAVDLSVPEFGRLTVLTFHATPPVFDGPEDRNGRRNHDETVFWLHFLDGVIGEPPDSRFVLLGDANLDPLDGDGRKEAIDALLADPRLQDPKPRSEVGTGAADMEGGANLTHLGDPALDTANWADGPDDPGNLRVDYVLPSRDWIVTDSGIAWGSGGDGGSPPPRHGLVWADLVPGG